MHNEGASKGILVATSGYGQASFEFAEGKPLELLSGSNLLYLLSEHAGIEARIEPPEDWVDPVEQCYRPNSLTTTVVRSARIFEDRVDSATSLKTS